AKVNGTVSNAANATTATTALSANSANTANAFTGPLAGDVTGGQGATHIAALQGIPLIAGTPADQQVLQYRASSGGWVASTPPAFGTVTQVQTGAGLTGGPITTNGTIAIAAGGVSNVMLSNSTVTVAAGSGLS